MKIFNNLEGNRILTGLNLSPITKIAVFILYCIVLVFTVIFGVYIITYFLFILAFLLIVSSLGANKILEKFLTLQGWQKVALIFGIALLLRWVMLIQTQVITIDIEKYITRSQSMLEGQVPYRDFYGGNKPPLYEFMLFLMGYTLTPGAVQFRAAFSVFDALIPVVLFYICTLKYNERFAITASLTYSIFPISIICIGLSGHYDSVVALFSLTSILLLFKNKLNSSGLFLGVAFALKIYPIVLLPFFLTTIKTWKVRILYVIFFALPTIVADGVLYLLSPSAFFEYLAEESEWMGATSIPITLEMIFNTTEIFSVNISWIVLGIFGILLLLLFIDWLSPTRDKNLLKWLNIMVVIFAINYGVYLIFGILYYDNPLYLALIAVIIYFSLIAFLLYKLLPRIIPERLAVSDSEALLIVSTFAIMLFTFGLPNYAPWYFIWFFPFLLAIRTDKIRRLLLWIFPWWGLGVNMSLLPGTPPVN